jgi:uncharacterized membrane protein
MLSTNRIWTIISVLATIGIGLAIYLFYSYLAPEPPTICNISASVNCDPVTKGNLAEWFGVPVSLIGLIGYIVILGSALAKKKTITFAMTTFGMLFCLRLTYLEIFVEKIICPVCVLCQLIMLTIFILTLILLKRKDRVVEAMSDGDDE